MLLANKSICMGDMCVCVGKINTYFRDRNEWTLK